MFKEAYFYSHHSTISLYAPWVCVEFDADPSLKDLLLQKNKINHKNFQAALEKFREFSIFFETPRKNLLPVKPFYPVNIPSISTIPNFIDIPYLLKKARAYSSCYDPLTVFQILEKESVHFQSRIENETDIYSPLNALINVDKEKFKKALIYILNQTFYITNNFSKIVNPHTEVIKTLNQIIINIYEEEVGHDKLIKESLSELGVLPENGLVIEESKQLMNLLEECIKKSHICFAILISQLEGSYYPDKDPLVSIIEKSHIPRVALGLKKHFNINKSHNHISIGYKVANAFKQYLSYEEVIQAVRVTEFLNYIQKSTDKKIIDFIK